MANPTPGPWRAEPADMFGDHNIVLAKGDDDSRAIAAVVSNMRDPQEVAANARLIAAAPDMLAALEALVEGVDRLLGKPEPYECDDGALAAARAAILKATGGQQ